MYKVETNVPPPADLWRGSRKPGPITRQMRQLEPNQSFVVPMTDPKYANAFRYVANENVRSKRLQTGVIFTGRHEPNGGYRIWRVE